MKLVLLWFEILATWAQGRSPFVVLAAYFLALAVARLGGRS